MVAAGVVPGASVRDFKAALAAAAVIAILNAILPPLIAAARLPFMALAGFLVVLVLDGVMLLAADHITNGDLTIDSFWSALGVALVAAAVGVALDVVLGTNDDDTYAFRVIQRIARRSGERVRTDVPGIVFLEIDGLALPVLQLAMRDGSVPNRIAMNSVTARISGRMIGSPLAAGHPPGRRAMTSRNAPIAAIATPRARTNQRLLRSLRGATSDWNVSIARATSKPTIR